MGRDKLLHFGAGALLSLSALLLPLWAALGLICVAAVGKELRDAQGFGTPEILDAVATIAGGVLGLTIIRLAKEILC